MEKESGGVNRQSRGEQMPYTDFYQDIKSNALKPLYLFYGPETFLIDSMLAHAKGLLIDSSTEAFNYQVENAEVLTAEEIIQKMETMPLMSERRLIIFKNATFFSKKSIFTPSGDEALKAVFQSPSPSTVAIFVAPSLDKRFKWQDYVAKKGRVVHFERLDETEFRKWISQRLAKNKIDSDERSKRYLIDRLGYLEYRAEITLQEIDQQLETLVSLSAEAGKLTQHAIDQVIPQNVEADMFKLIDAVFDQKIARALMLLGELRSSGEPEMMILGNLYKTLTLMHTVKLLSQMGYSEAAVAKRLGMNSFRVRKLYQHAKGYEAVALANYIVDMADLDRRMKTGRINFWLATEQMLIALALKRPMLAV
jgi:DNA polymerase-3 subunit delta